MGASFARRLSRFATRFARDEGGAVTVEAVLWIPFFFFVLTLITDVSMAFHAKAQAFRAVEDGNRLLSVGTLTTPLDTQNYVQARFRGLAPTATAVTELNSRIITTRLTFKAREVVLFNTLGVMSGWDVQVGAQQYKELM